MKIKLLKDAWGIKVGTIIPAVVHIDTRNGYALVHPSEYELVPEESRTTLSRRDEFAKAALMGLLVDTGTARFPSLHAESAVIYADALIAELDKEKV